MDCNRRNFLAMTLAAPFAAGVTRIPGAEKAPTGKPAVCVFSKHLQSLSYKELAETCRKIELDGVDLTVRKGGHVLPENVERDLPAAVEALRAEGLEASMITTRLASGEPCR